MKEQYTDKERAGVISMYGIQYSEAMISAAESLDRLRIFATMCDDDILVEVLRKMKRMERQSADATEGLAKHAGELDGRGFEPQGVQDDYDPDLPFGELDSQTIEELELAAIARGGVDPRTVPEVFADIDAEIGLDDLEADCE